MLLGPKHEPPDPPGLAGSTRAVALAAAPQARAAGRGRRGQAEGARLLMAVRGEARYDLLGLSSPTRREAGERKPASRLYADPYYWAGYQFNGW